ARRPADPAQAAAALMMPRGRRETGWFLAFAIGVGGGWEVLYRGYLFWSLAPLTGGLGAVAAMALSYGVAHGYRGPGALAASIAGALFFAGGYALTGSLWWLIVLHVGLPLIGLRVRPMAPG
ncbi:CPBP family intramembrane glutamic endopeptidase, partial [Sphingomonas bacterium]|uniref:CPBP family intramembrane glutamic endopeptidase n=1 Tax=Sphingomonas bacterium TaxID=1895847 RepID=UPI001576E9F4